MNLKIGITGNIGSGKSLVCSVFERMGVPVFYADDETKKLYQETEIRNKIIAYFGSEVYFEDGTLNRKLLAYHLFKNAEALTFVEATLYPVLQNRFDQWTRTHSDKHYTLYEAAILFEKHLEKHFDKIIFVSAPEDIRLQRVIKRDSTNEEIIRSRMKLQWQEDEKIKKSDFVILNDSKQMLIPQIVKIHKQIMKINSTIR